MTCAMLYPISVVTEHRLTCTACLGLSLFVRLNFMLYAVISQAADGQLKHMHEIAPCPTSITVHAEL
jgi:hypothetical protein